MNSTILAVDLGKFNSVFCWLDPDARGERFRAAPTTPDDLRRELTRQPVERVVFEACSQAGWVHDLCTTLGLAATVASTAGEAWRWSRVKRKTDRDDARKLARLAAVGEVQGVPVPPRDVRQRKSLIGLRKRLVAERVRGQNRIRGLLVCQGLPAPVGARAWTAVGRAGLAAHARPLAACGPGELWRGLLDLTLTEYRQVRELLDAAEAHLDQLAGANAAVQLLQTTPGVGPRAAGRGGRPSDRCLVQPAG